MSHDWMAQAACVGADPELFFPTKTGLGGRLQAERAAQVCADCPVVAECAAFGSKVGYGGVYGGKLQPYRKGVGNRTFLPHGTEAQVRGRTVVSKHATFHDIQSHSKAVLAEWNVGVGTDVPFYGEYRTRAGGSER